MFWKHWVDLNRESKSWALVSHDHENLMLECPHGCMHDQFCIKFPNHHCCMCVMEIMWDLPLFLNCWPNRRPDMYHVQPFYKPWGKILTHDKPWPRVRMSILALRRKQKKKEKEVPDQISEESKRRKFPIKDWKKAKHKEKFPSKENKRNIQKGLQTRQYLNNTELSQANKKRKETTTWSGPLPLIANQNPVRRWLFRLALKKTEKEKAKTLKAKFPTKKHHSRKSSIDPWSRM